MLHRIDEGLFHAVEDDDADEQHHQYEGEAGYHIVKSIRYYLIKIIFSHHLESYLRVISLLAFPGISCFCINRLINIEQTGQLINHNPNHTNQC